MNLVERIIHNQQQELSIHIGIDKMNISANLKERIIKALYNNEDFALVNENDDYAYFLAYGFMIYKSHDNKANSVTELKDVAAFQNAVKVTLLGHRKFVSAKALQLNANYLYLKDGLKTEQVKLMAIRYVKMLKK